MKIPFNLLSTSLRKQWFEVPCQPRDRSAGIARVKLQEIPGDAFDEMWATLAEAEKEVARLGTVEPLDVKKLREARKVEFEARKAILEACIIDHDKETFASEVPTCDPESRQGQNFIAQLLEMGYTLDESQKACVSGLVKKPFDKKECATFYERCQPDNVFATTLLIFIERFHHCETLTPQKHWDARGAKPLPLDPAKEAPK